MREKEAEVGGPVWACDEGHWRGRGEGVVWADDEGHGGLVDTEGGMRKKSLEGWDRGPGERNLHTAPSDTRDYSLRAR